MIFVVRIPCRVFDESTMKHGIRTTCSATEFASNALVER